MQSLFGMNYAVSAGFVSIGAEQAELVGSTTLCRTEGCIYAPDEDVAGSIDMVLKQRDSAGFFFILWTGSVVKSSRTSTMVSARQ